VRAEGGSGLTEAEGLVGALALDVWLAVAREHEVERLGEVTVRVGEEFDEVLQLQGVVGWEGEQGARVSDLFAAHGWGPVGCEGVQGARL
jgi:hypothetical protein